MKTMVNSAEEKAVARARMEVEVRVADGVKGEADGFVNRSRKAVGPAPEELDGAVGQEMLPEVGGQGVMVGLRAGEVVVGVGVRLKAIGGGDIWPHYQMPEVTPAAGRQVDVGVVWQGELAGDDQLVRTQRLQSDVRRKLVARHQLRSGLRGQEWHEAHGRETGVCGRESQRRDHGEIATRRDRRPDERIRGAGPADQGGPDRDEPAVGRSKRIQVFRVVTRLRADVLPLDLRGLSQCRLGICIGPGGCIRV